LAKNVRILIENQGESISIGTRAVSEIPPGKRINIFAGSCSELEELIRDLFLQLKRHREHVVVVDVIIKIRI